MNQRRPSVCNANHQQTTMDLGGGGNGDVGGEDATWSCFGVDATPLRHGIDTTVDEIRAALGLAPISAAMARHRRALEHLRRAAKYVELRTDGRHDDPLCLQVQAALATRVRGVCGRCGCNFCIVPAEVMREADAVAVGAGNGHDTIRCGCCSERVETEAAAPPPAVARREGWQPWHQGYSM